jgi:RimJ/RimL family protein N-acetyltransferase
MVIRTNRLLLREYVENDWQAVLAYQQNPKYLKYYQWTERSTEEVREFVAMFLDYQQENPRLNLQLALTLKSTDQLIGSCGIRMISRESHEADIGFEVDPDFWGQGYASEAAGAIVRYGFDELRLHRIWARCIADNLSSRRVLEKLGMRQEGRLRENEYFQDRWWDTLIYAVLEHEWQANRAGGTG